MEFNKGFGADESPYDVRTFAFVPSGVKSKGGTRYKASDIEDQHKVGICTAISTTQNARKATGIRFSAEFQYLMQKKLQGNWDEGSALYWSLKVAKNIGMLPEKYWKFTTEDDRKLSYDKYIKKLQAVSDREIEKLKVIASDYKISAYAKVPVDRDLMAEAILESKAGILTRYPLGREWWTKPIEPLQPPKKFISGHAVTDSNYDGNSFRIANTWGSDWADKGTAYRLQEQYAPTEAWIVYYDEVPKPIQTQKDNRVNVLGKVADLLQQVVVLYQKLKSVKNG